MPFYPFVTERHLAFAWAAARQREEDMRSPGGAAGMVHAMWSVHLTELAEALARASALPTSDPLQLVIGLLLTIALAASR